MTIDMNISADWDEDQEWEREWWGNCVNTMDEELKQVTYARCMEMYPQVGMWRWPVFDLGGKKILDIGGGPTSLLLKCVNRAQGCVVADPCDYPEWVTHRYAAAEVTQIKIAGEDIDMTGFDEVWIYNVLQHVDDPKKIVENAKKAAPVVRIFEWVDIPPHKGHPHELKALLLNEWLGGFGTVEQLSEGGCQGKAFYGVFGL